MLRFIKSLQFIFQPDFWYKSFYTSRNLDIEINRLLDKGNKFTNIEDGYADLDWLKNIGIRCYPYGFCSYRRDERRQRIYKDKHTVMPFRLTCKRVKKVLEMQGVDV
jgi:hypothetical protein